jgi:hypothetical protein
MSESLEKIPFDEISAGTTARITVIDDVQYLSSRDVLMHISGQNNKGASKIWERLSDSRKEELSSECRTKKFPGRGEVEQPVISFKGVLKLVMWIGGENAKKYRTAMVSILSRYYAGDGTLTDEIEANAKSTSPIQQMAKASIGIEHIPVEERSLEYKRKLEELEYLKLEAEVGNVKRATRAAELTRMERAYEHITKVTSSYRELCKDKDMDASALQILKESLLNKAILEGDHSEAPDDAPPKPERKRQKRKHHVKPSVAQPAYQPLRDVWHLSDFKAFLGDMWEEPEEDDSMMEGPD